MPNWIDVIGGPSQTAAMIAPAVRSLCNQKNEKYLVRFTESENPGDNDLKLDGNKYKDLEQFYEELERVCAEQETAEAVFIKGIGRFSLETFESEADSKRLAGKVVL